jgi:hypothetical protein
MSPKPDQPVASPKRDTSFPETPRFAPDDVRPLTIMTEGDAYISERMKTQPKNLTEIEVIPKEDKTGLHRLSLPDFFEQYSFDCTAGIACIHHGWAKREVMFGLEMKMDRWEQTRRGKYVFRWLSKNKRSLDQSLNVKDWYLVNRSFFPEAPKILFSINGGIENGDAILGFMPVTKAIEIRSKPARDSQDRVHSEENKHETDPNFYKAKIDSERVTGDDFQASDAVQENRDF